jgi:hypothetical protein
VSDTQMGLDDYEVQLAALRVENELLRRSAQTFAELAERLNDALMTAAGPEASSLPVSDTALSSPRAD